MSVHKERESPTERPDPASVAEDAEEYNTTSEESRKGSLSLWERSIPAPLRALLRFEALWFGLLAVFMALEGQRILTPDGYTDPNADITTAIRWYALAVIVLLVGWSGSYRNRSLVRIPVAVVRGLGAWFTPAPDRSRVILVSVGVVANVLAIVLLHSNWYSLPGSILWLLSLCLLIAGYLGDRRAEAREAGEEKAVPPARRWELVVFAVIMALAIGMRLWRLGDLSPGMHGDEGEAGTQALAILDGNHVSPWMRGWFNQPNIYYWSLAICMRIFGTGLFGLRTFAALCGVVTVLFVYLIAREMFGVRAAIIAGFLTAFGSADLLFSRQEFSNVSIPPLEAGAFYFVVRGLRTRRHIDFAIAGLLAGFGVYYFAGGRLIAPTVALFLGYLAVFHRPFLRAYWSRVLAFGISATAIAMPFVAYYLTYPIPSNNYPNDRFIWLHHDDLAVLYGSADWKVIVWGQLTRTLSVLTYSTDMSAMSVLDYPVARPLEAICIVLGLAWAIWRWRDSRFTLLSLWFWITLIVGGVLTIDAPNLPRILGILPVLSLAIAAVLDHLATLIGAAYERLDVSGRSLNVTRHWHVAGRSLIPAGRSLIPASRWVGGGAAAAVVLVSGVQNKQMYIDHYLNTHTNTILTAQAQYVQNMGTGYYFYGMGAPIIYWTHGDNRFINPHALGEELINTSDSLPLTDNGPNAHMNAAFLVWPNEKDYLNVLQAYYPEGHAQIVRMGDPEHLTDPMTGFTVSREAIDSHRTLLARYRPAQGGPIMRREPQIGLTAEGPPAGLHYPARASWDGALVAPDYDSYTLRVEGPAGTRFSIDGLPLHHRTSTLMLAQGLHTVHLEGVLTGSTTKVAVKWAPSTGILQPVPRRYIWDDHVGRGWLGTITADTASSSGAQPPVQQRVDGFLGFRATNLAFADGPVTGIWKGTINAPEDGVYGFTVNAAGSAQLFIDGHPVVNDTVTGLDPQTAGGQLSMQAGTHTIEVQYHYVAGTGYLETWWTPPGSSQQYLMTPYLRPAGRGVTEVTGVPRRPGSPPVSEPSSTGSTTLTQVGSLSLRAAPSARTMAVSDSGTVYTGDSAGHTITELGAGGKVIRTFGGAGAALGRFRAIDDMEVGPDGELYVLDGSEPRVQRFGPDGTLRGAIDGHGSWCAPHGFGIGPGGEIALADTCNNAVDLYSRDGQLRLITHGASAPGKALKTPFDAAFGPGGTVLVVDGRDRLAEMSPAGAISRTWRLPTGFESGSHLSVHGNLAILTGRRGIVAVSLSGTQVALVHAVSLAAAVAAGPRGQVWVLDPAARQAVIFAAGGGGR